MFTYHVSAVGFGSGYNTYNLDFNFSSNYDRDQDDDSFEMVWRKMDNEIVDRGVRNYKVISIEKVLSGSEA